MMNLDEIKRRSLDNLKFCEDFQMPTDKVKLMEVVSDILMIIEDRAYNCTALVEDLEKCKETLEFYADEVKWLRARVENRWDIPFKDDGAMARKTLKEVFGDENDQLR